MIVRKKIITLTLLFPAVVIFSCGQGKGDSQEQQKVASSDTLVSDSLRYEYLSINKSATGCAEDGTGCYTIDIEYLNFPDHEKAISDTLNKICCTYFTSCLTGSGKNKSCDILSAVDESLADFEKYREEDPEFSNAWYMEGFSNVPFLNKHLISISIGCSGYQGGAHSNSEMREMTFDMDQKTQLKSADLFTDPEKVNQIAESIFRKSYEIPKGTSLYDFGYDGFEDGFALNDNFTLRTDGIYYYFNSYEIASYVMGPSEILIRYDQVSDLLKPEIKEKMGF